MTTSTSSPDRAPNTRPSRTNRSRMANGALFPPGVDGRSAHARRWRDVHAELAEALGREPGPGERALLRRAASLSVACERLDADLATGQPADPDAQVRLSNALGRVLASLGLVQWRDPPRGPEAPPDDPRALFERVRDPERWR